MKKTLPKVLAIRDNLHVCVCVCLCVCVCDWMLVKQIQF